VPKTVAQKLEKGPPNINSKRHKGHKKDGVGLPVDLSFGHPVLLHFAESGFTFWAFVRIQFCIGKAFGAPFGGMHEFISFFNIIHLVWPPNQSVASCNSFFNFYLKIRGRGVFFLSYKPGAAHPVASAPFKALTSFCISTLLAEKRKPSRARHGMVVDFTTDAGLLPAKPDSGNCLAFYCWLFKTLTPTRTDAVFCLSRRQ
jgi:hypothetical protein